MVQLVRDADVLVVEVAVGDLEVHVEVDVADLEVGVEVDEVDAKYFSTL